MKITLVISSLGAGGAERVMTILAKYWVSQCVKVTLITLSSKDDDFYELDPRVTRVALNVMDSSTNLISALKNNFIRITRLRRAIQYSRPDIYISFMVQTNIMTLIATLGMPIPIIVSEHNDPRRRPVGRIWELLRRLTYLRARAVVVLTAELSEVALGYASSNQIHVIPNPAVPIQMHDDLSNYFELPSRFIVAMGNLLYRKGFDLLLDAYSQCKLKKEWSLVILGEGVERANLESLICELGIESSVLLPGRVNNPGVILSKSDLFVLSSRDEGFPMALVEAMSCRLAVISFDCPTGPSDIIRNNVDGILLPRENVPALTAALDRLMEDELERNRLAERAVEVIERFSIGKVVGMWNKLIEEIIAVPITTNK